MADFLMFLAKASAIQLIFYVMYAAFFRRHTFFAINRVVLVATILMSYLIPFISIPSWSMLFLDADLIPLGTGAFLEETATSTSMKDAAVEKSLSIFPWLWIAVYAIGVVLVFLHTVRSTLFFRAIMQRSNRVETYGVRVHLSPYPYAFTLFNKIHLPQSNVDQTIFLHEQAHVQQKHWIDLVITELNTCLLWFNPIAWRISRELRLQHELLADYSVIRQNISIEKYLFKLYRSLSENSTVSIVPKFNSQSIKTRIIMMTKKQSSPRLRYLYLLIVPAMLACLGFARYNDTSPIKENRIIVIDPAHGGEDAGSGVGDMSEKKISLELGLLVKQIGQKKGLDIRLTREKDQTMTLGERVRVSKESGADVFISLHIGFDEDEDRAGVSCFINEEKGSHELGSSIIKNFRSLREMKMNGVHASHAYVLKNNEAPSAIVELGYLSNKKDAEFLSKRSNLVTVAEKIVDVLSTY